MNIGKVLRTLRIERRLNLEEVSSALDIAVSTLSEYERGITKLSIERFISLLDFYNIDPLAILNGKEIIDITHFSESGKQKIYEICLIEKRKADCRNMT